MRRMIRRNPGRCALLMGSLAFCLTLWVSVMAPVGGSESRVMIGQEGRLFGGRIATWAAFDADGELREAGLTLPYSVVEQAPEEPAPDQRAEVTLEFPSVVKRSMFLDHLDLLWRPAGHDAPQGRDLGRFELRFVEMAKDVPRIDCPRPGPRPADAIEAEEPGTIMAGGIPQGEACLLEPVIGKAVLEKKHSFSLPVPAPPEHGQAALYPHRLEAVFDPGHDVYRIFLSDLRPVA